MQICTLASGSSGNSLFISSGETKILLDVGISARRITTSLRTLGVDPASLSAILITHSHTDHMSGLATLTKQLGLPVYATAPTLRQLCYRVPFLERLCQPIVPGNGVSIGGLWAESFATPHDAQGSVGYTLTDEGGKFALATDLGHLTQEVLDGVLGADLLVGELNHDEDWVKDGPYPPYLKARILGDEGHLSNEAGAELLCRAAEEGAGTLLLAHLSAENNSPARARETAARRLKAAGIDPERDVHLAVAPRSQPGPVYCLEGKGRAVMRVLEGAGC